VGDAVVKRYLRLLRIFWSNAFATELEYRVNFWSNALLSLFWLGWAAAGIGVYFQFTDSVRGWTYPEMLVVLGFFFAINGLRQALISPNLARLSEYVRLGTLDFLLTKPVNSQFMVSFRYVGVYNWFDPLLGFVLAGVGLTLSGRSLTLSGLLGGVLLMLCAVVLLYALALVLMGGGIRWVSSEGLEDVIQGIVETARLPVQMYRGVVQTALTVVLPVAFFTTFPAEALLGRGDPVVLIVAPLAAVAAVALGSFVWRRSLRGYTGASA
jgi:ABC-2 type transport system permease protein